MKIYDIVHSECSAACKSFACSHLRVRVKTPGTKRKESQSFSISKYIYISKQTMLHSCFEILNFFFFYLSAPWLNRLIQTWQSHFRTCRKITPYKQKKKEKKGSIRKMFCRKIRVFLLNIMIRILKENFSNCK